MENLNTKIANKPYHPIKVIQFGEGNFLRAFVDWILQRMNDKIGFDAGIVVVQPMAEGRVRELALQDGLYTLYLQGIKDGKVVREHQVIDVLDDFVNPFTE
jgi:tagaturonate reductase